MQKKIKHLLIICIAAIICIGGYVLFHYQHTSSERLPDKYNAVIEQVHSTVDQDGDGIDDQIDILPELSGISCDYGALRSDFVVEIVRAAADHNLLPHGIEREVGPLFRGRRRDKLPAAVPRGVPAEEYPPVALGLRQSHLLPPCDFCGRIADDTAAAGLVRYVVCKPRFAVFSRERDVADVFGVYDGHAFAVFRIPALKVVSGERAFGKD